MESCNIWPWEPSRLSGGSLGRFITSRLRVHQDLEFRKFKTERISAFDSCGLLILSMHLFLGTIMKWLSLYLCLTFLDSAYLPMSNVCWNNHNGPLFTTLNKYIWPKNFWFSCIGKKVPFWQFFRIFKNCQNGTFLMHENQKFWGPKVFIWWLLPCANLCG